MRILLFLLLVITFVFSGSKCPVTTYIPDRAKEYMDTVYIKSKEIIGEIKYLYYVPSLIEHESCVRLCGKGYYARKCWSPSSELKTKREQGVGFGQITRAWRKDGTLRFDTLYNLKRRYPKELKELNWNNIKERPDLQITAILLLWKEGFLYFNKNINLIDRIAFADSIYNGGYKYLKYERKYCGLIENCDPDIWFNNVENVKSARAKRKLYGNRSAWDINRNHVKDVLKIRLNKYKEYYENRYYKYNMVIEYENGGIAPYLGE